MNCLAGELPSTYLWCYNLQTCFLAMLWTSLATSFSFKCLAVSNEPRHSKQCCSLLYSQKACITSTLLFQTNMQAKRTPVLYSANSIFLFEHWPAASFCRLCILFPIIFLSTYFRLLNRQYRSVKQLSTYPVFKQLFSDPLY